MQRSIQLEKPIIIVTVAIGKMRSAVDLLVNSSQRHLQLTGAHHESVSERCENRATMDQIHAHHPLGDNERVTVSGDPADATSIWCLMKSKIPLSEQAIVQSTLDSCLRTFEQAQDTFDRLVIAVGASGTALIKTKLDVLRALSPGKLVKIFAYQSI